MMHRAFLIGVQEKHRVDFRVHWWGGFISIACDGRVIFRKPLVFKIEHTFEIGYEEKHFATVFFNLFDYFHEVFKILVDGQVPTPAMEIRKSAVARDVSSLPDSAVDEAAAALLFIALTNTLFAFFGEAFVAEWDPFLHRWLPFLAALFYGLFAVAALWHRVGMLLVGAVIFILDSLFFLMGSFSWSGLVVRGCLLYYLVTGLAVLYRRRSSAGGASS